MRAFIVASDLPAASSAHAVWFVTATILTSHQPPAGPSRMWLWAGSGMSVSADGSAPRAPAIRLRSTVRGWLGHDATAHIGAGSGLAKSGTMTYRTERSALATGPTFESAPTSQPLEAPAATLVSQKYVWAYWTVTVRPSTQAGVVAA